MRRISKAGQNDSSREQSDVRQAFQRATPLLVVWFRKPYAVRISIWICAIQRTVTLRYRRKLAACAVCAYRAAIAELGSFRVTTAPHILVVDDDRQIRASLCRYLTANGLRTTQAADAAAMFAALSVGRFDLIVLDLMMPGEDGLSACRRLRATSLNSRRALDSAVRGNRPHYRP